MGVPVIRHMHFIWGGPKMPERYRANLRAWHDLHPDWEITLWGDGDLAWLEHRDLYDDAASYVSNDAIWQFRSDIARYEILRKHGGLYLDTDFTPLRSIESALDGYDAFAVAETPHWVANGLLYVNRPHHPVIEHVLADLRENIEARSPAWATKLTGPQFMTPRWRAHGCHEGETELFLPLSFKGARRGDKIDLASLPPETYTAHEWGHIRSLTRQRR